MEIQIRRSHIIAASVIVILTASTAIYFLTRPKPQPWLDYPTDGQTLVTQFMNDIKQDTNPAFNDAYKLVNLPDRKPDDDSHLQIYHNINMYLAALFGKSWADHMTIIAIDPDKLYEIHVGKEILHIDVVPQGPPKGPLTNHLGIADIREFSMTDSGKAAQLAVIDAIIKGTGGPQAAANIKLIFTTRGNFSRMTTMERKQMILPFILDPNTIDGRGAMLHLNPIRDDPTVIDVLTQIKNDQRYAAQMRNTAEEILENRVDEAAMISIGE